MLCPLPGCYPAVFTGGAELSTLRSQSRLTSVCWRVSGWRRWRGAVGSCWYFEATFELRPSFRVALFKARLTKYFIVASASVLLTVQLCAKGLRPQWCISIITIIIIITGVQKRDHSHVFFQHSLQHEPDYHRDCLCFLLFLEKAVGVWSPLSPSTGPEASD